METAPDISVLIVNFNGGAYLQGALDSLKCQVHRSFEVIVIDNASTDGSADALDTDGLPAFTLMREAENHGFARGNNLAAARARGRWIALLNPDAEADPGWLSVLMRAIGQYPDVRAFASAQLALEKPGLMDGAGDAYHMFGFPWRGGFGRPASEMPETGWCFSACGAAALHDHALFRAIGGFDERFFCYCEDVDLGFRLQLAGHDCLFVSDGIVHHAGSGITGRTSAFSTYHGTRNRIWTYVKNMPPALLLATLPGHVLLTLYIVARNAFTPRFIPMIRGLKDGLKGIPAIRRASPWKLDSQPSPAGLLARMSYNPWRMSSRKPHIRKLAD